MARAGTITFKIRRLLGLELAMAPQIEVPKAVLGTEYGAHCVCLDGLGRDSVVYSVGLGEDISFDLELMERCGVSVHGFDPTPRSIAWLKAQDLPSGFILHEVGLGAQDGELSFNPPENPAHISHTLLDRPETAEASITVPIRRLSSIMEEQGHERLDVLKLDIEGSEYEVIDDLLARGLDIDQLLIEFHHQFDAIPLSRTRAAIAQLNAAGYQVFHVSPSGHEVSFLRR
jgi:FkbM family methyltransferase